MLEKQNFNIILYKKNFLVYTNRLLSHMEHETYKTVIELRLDKFSALQILRYRSNVK